LADDAAQVSVSAVGSHSVADIAGIRAFCTEAPNLNLRGLRKAELVKRNSYFYGIAPVLDASCGAPDGIPGKILIPF